MHEATKKSLEAELKCLLSEHNRAIEDAESHEGAAYLHRQIAKVALDKATAITQDLIAAGWRPV